VARELRGGAQHRHEIQKRDRTQFLVPLRVYPRRIIGEAPVAVYIRGIERGDLSLEPHIVVNIIEARAVRPAQAVEGRDRDERDIAAHLFYAQ
jgi:hypothetical protein